MSSERWPTASTGGKVLPPLLTRNPVRREAFQQDLERTQVGTADIRVDEHHAACMRTIQDLVQKHFGHQKLGPRKHWLSLRTWTLMDSVKAPHRVKRMACERLKHMQQRTVLVRWFSAPCPLRERSVAAARGRVAQLALALQTFWARVKVAVRGEKKRHLQESVGSCGMGGMGGGQW